MAARHLPTPDRVVLAGLALVLAGLALGDFLVLRPNRIVDGAGISFLQAASPACLATAGLLASGLCAAAFVHGPRGIRLRVLLTAALGFVLTAGAGSAARLLLDAQAAQARVSLGAGYWAACLGLVLPLADAVRRRPPGDATPLLALTGFAAGLALLFASGQLDGLSLVRELALRQERFLAEAGTHLFISCASVGASVLAGVPLGLAAARRPHLGERLFLVLNVVQTLPSLALFGLMIAPLALLAERIPALRAIGVQGIGWAPAVVALTLYALLPVVRNTFVGFASVDKAVLDAGRGMGMNRLQLLRRAELPLALPVILGGIRVALVQNIGNTAVAALIGAGGLGVFIFQGLGQAAIDLILVGALPTMALALGADLLMQGLTTLFAPGMPRRGEP